MRISSTIVITKSEMLAVAKYNDTIESINQELSGYFGHEAKSIATSLVEKTKLLFGKTITKDYGPVAVEYSYEGMEINFNQFIEPEFVQTYFDLIANILKAYVPAMVTTAKAFKEASDMASGIVEDALPDLERTAPTFITGA